MSAAPSTGFLPVEGAELHYAVSGSGPAVVMVHAGIADLRMWDDQVPALSESYTVVRYDLRGFGRTRARPGPYSNRQDLADLLDHLGIDRAVVVGCSMGGVIALDFVLERPERASGLVWVCSGISGEMAPDEVFDPREIALFEESEAAEVSGDAERAAALDVRIWVDGPLQPEGRAPAHVRERIHAMSLANYTTAQVDGLEPQRLDPPAAGRPAPARPRHRRRARPRRDGVLRRGARDSRARRESAPVPGCRARAQHGAPGALHARPAGLPRRARALVGTTAAQGTAAAALRRALSTATGCARARRARPGRRRGRAG